MTDLEKIELAIRRAASQMPNGAARTFRLLADEIQKLPPLNSISAHQQSENMLVNYRVEQKMLD